MTTWRVQYMSVISYLEMSQNRRSVRRCTHWDMQPPGDTITTFKMRDAFLRVTIAADMMRKEEEAEKQTSSRKEIQDCAANVA